MKIIAKLFVSSYLLISLNVMSSEKTVNKDLIRQAGIYGELSILVGAFESIDEECKTQFISKSITDSLEKTFKEQTKLSYSEFGLKYGNPTETRERVQDGKSSLLAGAGGCNSERLTMLFGIVYRDKIEPLINMLKIDE